MDLHTAFNVATSALLALAMYQINRQDKAIDDLRNTLNAALGGLPNTYARRDDMQEVVAYLRRIEDKLDRKADK